MIGTIAPKYKGKSVATTRKGINIKGANSEVSKLKAQKEPVRKCGIKDVSPYNVDWFSNKESKNYSSDWIDE